MPSVYYKDLRQLLSVSIGEIGEEIDFLTQSMAPGASLPFVSGGIMILKCNKIFL